MVSGVIPVIFAGVFSRGTLSFNAPFFIKLILAPLSSMKSKLGYLPSGIVKRIVVGVSSSDSTEFRGLYSEYNWNSRLISALSSSLVPLEGAPVHSSEVGDELLNWTGDALERDPVGAFRSISGLEIAPARRLKIAWCMHSKIDCFEACYQSYGSENEALNFQKAWCFQRI